MLLTPDVRTHTPRISLTDVCSPAARKWLTVNIDPGLHVSLLKPENKCSNPACPRNCLAQIGATCQQSLSSADAAGLGIFSSSCRLRVRMCPQRYWASSVEGWQWDIDTDAQGWRFVATCSAWCWHSPHRVCETLHNWRRTRNLHQCRTCGRSCNCAFVNAKQLKVRDRLPPDSYLLVLVSPVLRQTPRLSSSPQITPGGLCVKVNTLQLRRKPRATLLVGACMCGRVRVMCLRKAFFSSLPLSLKSSPLLSPCILVVWRL